MSKIIFVLGSPNSDDGTLSEISLGRIKHAVALQAEIPEAVIVATGGFGEHFNNSDIAHRELVHRYLSQLDVPFLVGSREDLLSSDTVEDIRMIAAFAEARGCPRYATVTSNFHLQRCSFIFHCLEMKVVDLYPADDPPDLEIETLTHEARALALLKEQGGVVLDGVLHPYKAC